MLKKREGSSSLECLIVLIVLCTIFIGFCFFIKTVNIFVNKRISSVDEKRKIDVILESIYEDIKDDVSPEDDSLFDSVWVRNNSTEDGYLITLESLSGKINLNFLDSNVLLESGLSTVFNDSKSIREIESIRSERLLYSYDEIKDYISEENFSKYFSFYGFANINIMSEKSLELLVNSLTDSFCGSELNQKRNNLLANKQLIKTETEYNLFCGINYLDIFPYINLDAAINVNFIDEDCLYKLINYAGFGLISKKKKIDTLLSLREIREITQEDIITILGITKNDELYYYLGSKTWFWKISIQGKTQGCHVILCRSFEKTSERNPKFYIIEKRWITK